MSVQLVQIGADRNQIKRNIHTINPDHSQEDTGHHRGFSGPDTCIWKMEKDLFTTVGSGQLPQCYGHKYHPKREQQKLFQLWRHRALCQGLQKTKSRVP